MDAIQSIGLPTHWADSITAALQVATTGGGNNVLVFGKSLADFVQNEKIELLRHAKNHPLLFIETVGYTSLAASGQATHANTAEVLFYFHTYFTSRAALNNRPDETTELNLKRTATPETTKGLEDHSLDFLKGVSHEVRSFLNGISGPMQLLKDKIEAKDQFDLYTMIDRSISRLLRFTFKTALVSIIQEHKYILKHEKVELSSLIQHALLEMNDLKFSDTIKASIDKRSENIKIEGDTDLIIQCFEAIIERIVLNYGNNTELKISLQTDDIGDVVCNFNFPFDGILDEFQTIDTQIESDFKADLGLVLARHILDLHNATFSYKLLFNNDIEIEIRFKEISHE